ncbi:MAG: glycosyltransferase family 39 protein [Anaerolineae bacterium]|nr:glycosyltransferase family 39 protein [Anaerolineae bacterium]
MWLSTRRETLLLILILAFAAVLRLYGLTWDGGQWLHPDERQIYFVTLGLHWPGSLAEALSPASPLNPGFFAYGSLPFYLLRLVAALVSLVWPAVRDPDNLHLVARPLSALFDLGTIYLTYRLAHTLWPAASEGLGSPPHPPLSSTGRGSHCSDLSSSRSRSQCVGLLAAVLVGVAVLHIQLAHFYTADTLLTFFVMLVLNLAVGLAWGAPTLRRSVVLGVALGLALATKLTAAPLVLPVLVALVGGQRCASRIKSLALTLAIAAVVFLVVQPYALIDWQTFLAQTIRESQIAWGRLDVPYTRQYADALPYLYPICQTALWGLGLPLGLVAWAALAAALVRWLRHGSWPDALLLAWAGPYLSISGLLYAKYLRYMLPLIPVLCLLAVRLCYDLRRLVHTATGRRLMAAGCWIVAVASTCYAVAFVTVYASPHSWLVASDWIYRHIPAGSTLGVEDWDTALPLPLDVDGRPRRIEEYKLRTLSLYDEPDAEPKWATIAGDLAASDYLIVASRRLYGSIPRLPDRYPITARYYKLLFAGDLGFELTGEFTRGPAWLNLLVQPQPQAALHVSGAAFGLFVPDESFVVYDHPRALILRNTGRLTAGELLRRLEP